MLDFCHIDFCFEITNTIMQRNIWLVSISFCILFAAYNSLQNFATSLFPCGLGNQSLTVLYAVCALSVFAAPAFTASVGTKFTMVIGGFCYVIYLGSLIHIIPNVVLASSVVIGFGSAILWVALGVFLTENSTIADRGRVNGFFWSIFQLSNVAGNLMAYFILSKLGAGSSATTSFYIAVTVCALIGTLGLLTLQSPSTSVAEHEDSSTSSLITDNISSSSPYSAVGQPSKYVESSSSFCTTFRTGAWSAFSLLAHWQIICLLPIFFFSGFELSFWTGEFTLLLDSSVIGLVLTFAGVGEVCGGYFFGKAGDSLGRSASLVGGGLLYLSGLACTYWMRSARDDGPVVANAPLISYVAAFCFGAADASFNSNSYALCSDVVEFIQLHALDQEDKHPSNRSGPSLVHSSSSATSSSNTLVTGSIVNVSSALLDPSASFMQPSYSSVNTSSLSSSLAAPDQSSLSEGSSSSSGSFTIFQLAQNLGSCVGFFLPLYTPLHDPNPPNAAPSTCSSGPVITGHGNYFLIWLQVGLLSLSMLTFVYLDRLNQRLRK